MKVGKTTAYVDLGHKVVIYATNMPPVTVDLTGLSSKRRDARIVSAVGKYNQERKRLAASKGEL